MLVRSLCRSTSRAKRKKTKAQNTSILSSAFVMLRMNGLKEKTIPSSEASHLRIPTNSWTSSKSDSRSWKMQGDYENLIVRTRPMSWEASNKHSLRILAQVRLQPLVPLPGLRMARLSRVVAAQKLRWLLSVFQAKLNLSTPHRSQLMPHPTNRPSPLIEERPPRSRHTNYLHHSMRDPCHSEATMARH